MAIWLYMVAKPPRRRPSASCCCALLRPRHAGGRFEEAAFDFFLGWMIGLGGLPSLEPSLDTSRLARRGCLI